MSVIKLSYGVENYIAGKQYYKCANNPDVNLSGLKNYRCPIWDKPCSNKGSFDEWGYKINHKIKYCSIEYDRGDNNDNDSDSNNDNGGDNDDNNESDANLQALCDSCHLVKTERFIKKFIMKYTDKVNIDYLYDIDKKLSLDIIQKLVTKKYLFIDNFGITSMKNKEEFKDFVSAYYGKDILCFEMMFGYVKVDSEHTHAIKIVVNLLNILLRKHNKKYDANDLIDVSISRDQYNEAIGEIENSIYFTNEEENKKLFFNPLYKSTDKCNQSLYNSKIKCILDTFFIKFSILKHVRKNGKNGCTYMVSIDEKFKNIVDFKHGKANKVKHYPSLFK